MIESRPGDAFQPGDLVNNTYRIEQILGRGGTSDVYKARSEISGRLVALKMLKEEFSGNDDYLVLLTREEEIREVRHDAVVRYSENSRTADGHVYLLMDYVEGPGLDKKLKQGPMSAEELLTVCRRVAEGLRPDAPAALRPPGALERYRGAVRDYEVAFEAAVREAKRRAQSGFSEPERRRLQSAQRLMALAESEASTPAERQSAYRQARRELDGLIALPEATTDDLERRIAGELEA